MSDGPDGVAGLTRLGSILGTRVQRCEDQAFLTRGAIYTDALVDERLAGGARATFVRSRVAHARIVAVDISAAAAGPGVVAVLTAADLGGLPAHRMLPMYPAPMAQPLVATDVVRFVGEPVAVVLTEDGCAGEDAAEPVSVDYGPCRSSSTRRRPPRTARQSGGACQDAPRVGEPFARSTAPRATASKCPWSVPRAITLMPLTSRPDGARRRRCGPPHGIEPFPLWVESPPRLPQPLLRA